MKIATFLLKNGDRNTFRNKIMEIVKEFDEKGYNNGRPWKSSKILRMNPFFHFSFFSQIFLHFSITKIIFILSFFSFFVVFSFFSFFLFSFFSCKSFFIFSFFHFFNFSFFFIFFDFSFIFFHFLLIFLFFHFLFIFFVFFSFHFLCLFLIHFLFFFFLSCPFFFFLFLFFLSLSFIFFHFLSFSFHVFHFEQNVDFPVPGRGGRISGLQGCLPRQSSTALHVSPERISEQIVEQIVDISDGGLQDFCPGQSSFFSSHVPARVHEDAAQPTTNNQQPTTNSQQPATSSNSSNSSNIRLRQVW